MINGGTIDLGWISKNADAVLNAWYRVVNSRVQFHPDGGQFGFVWLSTRTEGPHGGASYVWCLTARRNQEKYPPEKHCRSFARSGTRGRQAGRPWRLSCTRRKPFHSTPMAVNSISFGSPRVRPMGRTCGEPNEIKKKYPPEMFYRSFS